MSNYSAKILVCFYKQVLLRPNNSIYLDLQCGKDDTNVDLVMTADNTGDNISNKNKYWSEITGLYWAWKNIDPVDYIGLCSYRRFFNFKHDPLSAIEIIPFDSISKIDVIGIPNLDKIFSNYDIVIPKPYLYAYSIKEVCSMNYRDEDFDLLESIVHEFSPEYDEAYRSVIYSSNKMIGHNMFIMSWVNFDEYCNWVFTILFELEKKIDPTNYPINQIRVFGYMHELLLAVFIEKKKLRKYYSQITWLTDDSKGFKFNNIFYKLLATFYFRVNKSYILIKKVWFKK